MNRFLADENLPFPSFRLLADKGIDITHVGIDAPSIDDVSVLKIAKDEGRILLTFDRDHGELIFTKSVEPPPGVVYFRLTDYRPESPGQRLLKILESGTDLNGFFTVVGITGLRRRALWLQS